MQAFQAHFSGSQRIMEVIILCNVLMLLALHLPAVCMAYMVEWQHWGGGGGVLILGGMHIQVLVGMLNNVWGEGKQ